MKENSWGDLQVAVLPVQTSRASPKRSILRINLGLFRPQSMGIFSRATTDFSRHLVGAPSRPPKPRVAVASGRLWEVSS